ncbi:MAG: 30S ribosomal protein S6 [Candidatus Dormibacteraeota bacterium]|uniref:Small ribosomal subunit protein bS6 n=1 Tax=Candidatus Amunia macphersoniae TaxID=3127014 RepID=A0A934KPD5_9BACT|nr:30S ribosomal protein S6 [Candidatus Dormibacteraeota bacterium]
MVRDYELMYIVRPELDDEALQGAVQSVEQMINGVGGSVVRSTSWGRRRLAYEVEHLRDGHYMLLHIRADGARVPDIERALTIHETVFRHLLVLHGAGAEVDAVDPDHVAGLAAAPARAAGDDDGRPERQTAVAGAAEDDDDEDGDDADDNAAAVPAATEEEN